LSGSPLEFTALDDGFRFRFADAVVAHYARKLFVSYVRGTAAPGTDLFALELVFGELVSNVVRHAPGPVDVHVLWLRDGMRLEVWDRGPGFELHADLPDDAMAESHRGLFLVAAFADDLRVERRGSHTVTSAHFSLRS
jgi:anti-sigma regulatory factor (Ser/Thr protein kinase)